MSSQLNKYSARITQPKSQGASQAMLYATRQLAAQQAEIGRWAKLSLSTGFDG